MSSSPDMLSHATYGSLAAAIQPAVTVPAPAVCAWCQHPYESKKGIGVFCSLSCYHAELAGGSGPALRSAHQVEQARRKTSIAPCADCSHMEKAHGTISRACLKRKGGHFDGALDQRRCRCTRFAPAEQPEAPTEDVLADDLFQQLVVSRFAQLDTEIARLKEQVSGLLARETV